MSSFIADENFPFPSFRLLVSNGIDVIHVGTDYPSISDINVLQIAKEQNRILLTFDKDHGELIFTGKVSPPHGVVYFRLERYSPDKPGRMLLDLIVSGTEFDGFFTVVKLSGAKKRALWLQS